MTDALRKAFETAGRLPEREQDELAAAILEELNADARWDAAYEPNPTLWEPDFRQRRRPWNA